MISLELCSESLLMSMVVFTYTECNNGTTTYTHMHTQAMCMHTCA